MQLFHALDVVDGGQEQLLPFAYESRVRGRGEDMSEMSIHVFLLNKGGDLLFHPVNF